MQGDLGNTQMLQRFFEVNYDARILDLIPHDISSGPLSGHILYEVETDFSGGQRFWAFIHPEMAVYPVAGMQASEILTFHLKREGSPSPNQTVAEPPPSPVTEIPIAPTRLATPAPMVGNPPRPAPYTIGGNDLQYLEVNLAPGQRVVAEPGALLMMTEGVEMSTSPWDNLREDRTVGRRLLDPLKRLVSGESLLVALFRNETLHSQTVLFTPPHPGSIVALTLAEGQTLVCQRGAFLCALGEIEIAPMVAKRLAAGIFSGAGLLLQKLQGIGEVFCSGGGTLVEHTIDPGRQIRIETGALVAWQAQLTLDVTFNRGYNLFAGEGLFLSTLHNPTDVAAKAWIQTVPFQRLAQKIHQLAPAKKD